MGERRQSWGRRASDNMRRLGRDALGCVISLALAVGGAWAAGQLPAEAAGAVAGDAARGSALFSGEQGLRNRAMPCIGCHHAGGIGALGGGTFASDLGDAGSRIGGADEFVPLLKEMPFAAMQVIYGPRPLTETEIADLAAFLGKQTVARADSGTLTFLGLGIAVMAVLAGLAQLLWRSRLQGVRRQLTGGR